MWTLVYIMVTADSWNLQELMWVEAHADSSIKEVRIALHMSTILSCPYHTLPQDSLLPTGMKNVMILAQAIKRLHASGEISCFGDHQCMVVLCYDSFCVIFMVVSWSYYGCSMITVV